MIGNGLGHYNYEVLREIHTIKIPFHHCNEEILNLCLNTTKNVPETVQ